MIALDKPIQDVSTEVITTKGYNVDKSKYYSKLTEEDTKAILLDYYISNRKDNIQAICDRYGISNQYLYKLVRKYKQNNLYEKVIESSVKESRKKFSKRVDIIIEKALDRINAELQDNSKDINLSQLTTTLGILYDKNALEQGKATSNNAFNINIKIDK